MLVLSRKESQSIVIGGDIEVTIVAIQGGRVKLAINAPRHVPIRRAELKPLAGPSLAEEATDTQSIDAFFDLDRSQSAVA